MSHSLCACCLYSISLAHFKRPHHAKGHCSRGGHVCCVNTTSALLLEMCSVYHCEPWFHNASAIQSCTALQGRLCSCLAASPAAQLWPPLLPCTFLLPRSPCHALPPALPKPFSLNCYYFIQLQILNLYLNTLQWPCLLCHLAQETPS